MKLVNTLLFIYCTTIVFLLLVSGIIMARSVEQLLILLVFFPVILHFIITIYQKIRRRKHPEQISDLPQKRSPGKKIAIALCIITAFLALTSTSIMHVLNTFQTKHVPTPRPTFTTTPTHTPSVASQSAVFIRTKGKTATSLITIRSEASSSAAIVKKVKVSEIFPVVTKKNGWYEIQVDTKTSGYIAEEFAQEENAPGKKE
jgi:hypothetical protein